METQHQYYYYTGADGGRRSLTAFIITIILIVVIVIAGVCVSFLLGRTLANIILLALIALLILIGLSSFFYIRKLNREVENQRQVHHQALRVQPTAPPMSTRTSWAFSNKNWRQSKQSALRTA